jgi:TctA family transporter
VDILNNIVLGFGVAFSPANLAYCFVGVTLGTLVGVLPGVGPLVTIAMLLPITFNLPAVSALIMLAGIYYGAQYGGSTTSILVNLPQSRNTSGARGAPPGRRWRSPRSPPCSPAASGSC